MVQERSSVRRLKKNRAHGKGRSVAPRENVIDEEAYGRELDSALEETQRDVSGDVAGQSWKIARRLVSRFRPTPAVLWPIMRNVFGRTKEPLSGSSQEMAFLSLSPLIYRALEDSGIKENLNLPAQPNVERLQLSDAVGCLGMDIAAALCYMHAISRRIAATMSDRIWRPIIEDALLRAQIGYYVGGNSAEFGYGRGMLAGFAGRAGLAIQIASGDMLQAQQTLEALAGGAEMKQAGLRIYRCEPLQVSAMALTAAGCSRDAAIGISSFSVQDKTIKRGSERYRWLAAFSIIEQLRMGSTENIRRSHWRALEYEKDSIDDLKARIQTLLRLGHSWGWVTEALAELESELSAEEDPFEESDEASSELERHFSDGGDLDAEPGDE